MRGMLCAFMGPALLVAGCASGASAPGVVAAADPRADLPADMALELTVWHDDGPGGGAPLQPPWPGHYVIFCDGSLHWEPGVSGEGGLPPLRRVLRRDELLEVWTLVAAMQADRDAGQTPILAHRRITAGPGELVCLGTFFADGRRWSVLERHAPGQGLDPATGALLGHLAALAWVDEAALRRPPPHRDDFGPDPYARYRR